MCPHIKIIMIEILEKNQIIKEMWWFSNLGKICPKSKKSIMPLFIYTYGHKLDKKKWSNGEVLKIGWSHFSILQKNKTKNHCILSLPTQMLSIWLINRRNHTKNDQFTLNFLNHPEIFLENLGIFSELFNTDYIYVWVKIFYYSEEYVCFASTSKKVFSFVKNDRKSWIYSKVRWTFE